MATLESIAESEAHARWIMTNHVGAGDRLRCTLCEQWWPCDLVGLAALAVRQAEQLRIATVQLDAFVAQGQERYPGEMGTFAEDALIQMSVVE